MAASLPMYFPEGFTLATAVTCAQLVGAAYDQYTQWADQKFPYMADFKWQPSVTTYTYSAPLYWTYDEGFYQEPIGFLAVANGVAYLTFRGTVSDQDTVYDGMVWQTPYTLASGFGNVHTGFYDIYTQLSPQVLAALAAANSPTPLTQIVFTGHSLGCALSSLAVPDVVANAGLGAGLSMIHVNMASPRVGDPTFAAAMNGGPVPTFRVVNTEDIVPDSPPPVGPGALVYQHFGTPVDFTANYLSVDGNHSLLGAYTYALNNPQSPQDSATAQSIAARRPGPESLARTTDARVGLVARASTVRAAMPMAGTMNAEGRVK